MLQYLLQRPIGVCLTLLVALALSTIAYLDLPVSLLPDSDVPEITIAVKVRDGSPEEIEQIILKPIRESMLSVGGLTSVESFSQNEVGKIILRFDYGTAMDLSYIEVNERIDRLTPELPSDLGRPTVIKATTADIPILRIQVIPKFAGDLITTSKLASMVLKRRLERLDGIGMVDLNGVVESVIRVAPKETLMKGLKITDQDIIETVKRSNLDLGALSVKDGNYQYFLKLTSRINTPEEIQELSIALPDRNRSVKLKEIATVYLDAEKPMGFHLFQGTEGIVINIHKQPEARMTDLTPRIHSLVNDFTVDYPQVSFFITQDQSLLLKLSILNLSQALLWGGAIAFMVLFFFMRGWRTPVIMGIVLPLSLLLSFSVFFLFRISLNIISLSGLALGLGMLVDNSIVVIDSIMLKRKEGNTLLCSCVLGPHEVIGPLLGSAMTNLVVFTPLIFMDGLTGVLFYEQALSVAAILSVSLLCTFLVVPLFYLLLFKEKTIDLHEDSSLFTAIKNRYEKSFNWVWKHKKLVIVLMTLLIPLALILLVALPKQGFPNIERKETQLSIDWNEPINAVECRRRVQEMLREYNTLIKVSEAEVGYQQFLLAHETYSMQHAEIYLSFDSEKSKENSETILRAYLKERFPMGTFVFANSPNAFEQLFSSKKPLLEARFRNLASGRPLPIPQGDSILHELKKSSANSTIREGFEKETMAFLSIDKDKLQQFSIPYSSVIEKLKILFGEFLIADFTSFGDVMQIAFPPYKGDYGEALETIQVGSINGAQYPIKAFISVEFGQSYKYITADGSGVFQSISIDDFEDISIPISAISKVAKEKSLLVQFSGTWFDDEVQFKNLIIIFIISILLMYVILTAEFESLRQPFLVMITLPAALAGSLVLLWLSGGTLNIMSGIGIIVALGVLDNDAILKIDRINRLRERLPLDLAIRQAGIDRFKPIVMNTCTNVLAIAPIIFSSGLGADLQRPVALTTIGGLIVGTLTALYYVPLLYYLFFKKRL